MQHYKFLKSTILGTPLKKETYNIIGAGISGLLLGYHLKKKGIPFKIYELTNRTGGLLQTQTTKYGLAEGAANGVLWCQAFEDMANHLKLDILTPNTRARNRYIIRDNQITRFPLSMVETILTFKNLFLPDKKLPVTVKEFSDSHLSKALSTRLLEAALGGIYAGRLEELSFPATLPNLAKIKAKNKSVGLGLIKKIFQKSKGNGKSTPKELKGTLSFSDGMQELVDSLTTFLKDHIVYNFSGQQFKGTPYPLILTLPAYHAMQFFDEHPLQKLLKEVNYSPILTATFFFNKNDIPNFREGFGCVIPRSERFRILGILFNHCIFEHRVIDDSIISLTCIARDFNDTLFKKTEEEIFDIFLQDISRLFELKAEPLEKVLYKWPKGIPLYTPELYESWFEMDKLLKKDFPNIRLFGNYTGGISVRQLCQEAAKAVQEIK